MGECGTLAFSDERLTKEGKNRAFVELRALKTLWFNTGSLCNLSCEGCYIESSPRNDQLQYLRPENVEPFLNEIRSNSSPVELVGFTGGEPFLNPYFIEILDLTLSLNFKVLVLTNAFRVLKKHKDELLRLKDSFGDHLKMRVSLDHYTQSGHERKRGKGTFEKTIAELKWLSHENFCFSIAGRSLPHESWERSFTGYQAMVREKGISKELSPDKLAIFPEMDKEKSTPEVSTECWELLGKKPEALMCASERMVVLKKGETHPQVMPCTLLAYNDEQSMGNTLTDAKKRVYLNHPFCSQFCVLGGASCSDKK